jgi:hypothetical protein
MMHPDVFRAMAVQEFDGKSRDIPRGNPRRAQPDVDFRGGAA